MLWIPKLFLLLATSIFWDNHALPFASPHNEKIKNVSVCDQVSNSGYIRIHPKDLPNLKEICQCANLREISLKNLDINELPEPISQIPQLESLNISKTYIARFPEEILSLRKLEKLDLSFTSIYFLPTELSELKNLKVLNLRGTQISALPSGLDHLNEIDMRMIEISRKEQEELRAQYPAVKIYFSSPCNCK